MHKDIIQLLDQRRVKEALTQLNALIAETDYWKLKSEAENLQTTYNYMLQYAAQGMEDPEQGKLYRQIVRKAYELTDQLEFLGKYRKVYGQFADKMRQMHQPGQHRSYQELCQCLEDFSEDIHLSQLATKDDKQLFEKQQEIRKKHEKNLDELFDRIWTSTFWSEEEINQRLERLMRDAYRSVSNVAKHHQVSLRTAAFIVACTRILEAREVRGLYP